MQGPDVFEIAALIGKYGNSPKTGIRTKDPWLKIEYDSHGCKSYRTLKVCNAGAVIIDLFRLNISKHIGQPVLILGPYF
jgi:hypothetical protein